MNGARILVHTGETILPADQAGVPVLDHGFLFGDSVYEVVRSANGRSFMLKEHLDRMRRSAAMIYFDLPWSDGEIERRLQELLHSVQVPAHRPSPEPACLPPGHGRSWTVRAGAPAPRSPSTRPPGPGFRRQDRTVYRGSMSEKPQLRPAGRPRPSVPP